MGETHRVTIGDFEVGNDLPLTFIAGPCQLESRQHALDMSGKLAEIFGKVGANFIYKTSYDKANRSSGKTPRGIGLQSAGPVFREVRESAGCPVLTDVHLPEDCEAVAEFVDVLQIPAFLCRQTDLVEAAGRTGKTVHVKKGQFLAPRDMKNVVGKLEGVGNRNIMVCERGVSFGYNTLISDMRALPIMAQTGYPVVFDATHSVMEPGGAGDRSGGDRRFVPVVARAAVAVGVAAVFMETHEDPDNAPSDGPNMVRLEDMPALVEILLEVDRVAKANPIHL
ncbi:MAG: 3-deoxy-8-phosphooctulonate synthase [Pseudomonadota bacterium]